jgi:hypothetical protein
VYDGDKTQNGGWGKKNENLNRESVQLKSTRKQMQDAYYRHKRYNFLLKTNRYTTNLSVRCAPKNLTWNEELLKALKFYADQSTPKKDWNQIATNMITHFYEFKYNFTRKNVHKAYTTHFKK